MVDRANKYRSGTYANIKSGVQTVCRSDMALSALDNRWIQKVANLCLVM